MPCRGESALYTKSLAGTVGLARLAGRGGRWKLFVGVSAAFNFVRFSLPPVTGTSYVEGPGGPEQTLCRRLAFAHAVAIYLRQRRPPPVSLASLHIRQALLEKLPHFL